MSELIAITGKTGLPLLLDPDKKLRSFQPTATIHFQRYLHGVNGAAPVIQHDSTVILDARVFEGGGDGTPKMRDYIKAIRTKYANGSGPRILCLRLDIHDVGIERNDMKAGATATLFYMGNIPDATRRMNAFMETGALPSPRKGRVTTVMDSTPFNLFRDAGDSDDDDLPGDTQPKTAPSSSPLINDTPQSRHPASVPTKPTRSSVPKRKGESTGANPLQTQSIPPASTEEPVLGDQDMEALLAALKTISEQNTAVLALLEGIRDGINNLRAENEGALLKKAQDRISDVFASLQTGGEVRSVRVPSSTDTISDPLLAAPTEADVTLAPDAASKKKEPIAIATKGEPFMTNVSLFGKTISLRHLSADLFAHLVNTEDTLGSADVASMHKIGYQGGYSRISNLRADLDAFQKGLSSCLTCVQSGNSQRYRFDIDAFRKAFKMK